MEDGRVEFVRRAVKLAGANSKIAPQFFTFEDANKKRIMPKIL
jgi:hypothetical protein